MVNHGDASEKAEGQAFAHSIVTDDNCDSNVASDAELDKAAEEFEQQVAYFVCVINCVKYSVYEKVLHDIIETESQMIECEEFLLYEHARANNRVESEDVFWSYWEPNAGFVEPPEYCDFENYSVLPSAPKHVLDKLREDELKKFPNPLAKEFRPSTKKNVYDDVKKS